MFRFIKIYLFEHQYERDIMWNRTQQVHSTMVFRLPFGNGSLTFCEISKIYPSLASSMDGEDTSSCLCFYYSQNPVTSIYEFRDNDAEADIADMMEIDIVVCSEGESLSESQERKRIEQIKSRQNQPVVVKDQSSFQFMTKKLDNIYHHYQQCAIPDKKHKALQTLKVQFDELLAKYPDQSKSNQLVQSVQNLFINIKPS